MPTKPQWTKQLEALHACKEAVAWASQYPSLSEAWAVCERGDWMLWLIARTLGNESRSTLVLAACECARLALPYVPENEQRPLIAIETTEKWARGGDGITLDQVRSVADAAYAAVYAAHAAARTKTLKQCADIVRKHYPTAP